MPLVAALSRLIMSKIGLLFASGDSRDAEILALRHQILVLRRRNNQPQFARCDDTVPAASGITAIPIPPRSPNAGCRRSATNCWTGPSSGTRPSSDVSFASTRALQHASATPLTAPTSTQRHRKRHPDRARPPEPTTHHLRRTHQRVPASSLNPSKDHGPRALTRRAHKRSATTKNTTPITRHQPGRIFGPYSHVVNDTFPGGRANSSGQQAPPKGMR